MTLFFQVKQLFPTANIHNIINVISASLLFLIFSFDYHHDLIKIRILTNDVNSDNNLLLLFNRCIAKFYGRNVVPAVSKCQRFSQIVI